MWAFKAYCVRVPGSMDIRVHIGRNPRSQLSNRGEII